MTQAGLFLLPAAVTMLFASILAGTLPASGLPAERGFTIGFAVCAAAILIGVLASLRVPSHRGAIHVVAAPAISAD